MRKDQIVLDGVDYVRKDREVKTIPALVTEQIVIKNIGKGKVSVRLGSDPEVLMTLPSGEVGNFTFQCLKDVECFVAKLNSDS